MSIENTFSSSTPERRPGWLWQRVLDCPQTRWKLLRGLTGVALNGSAEGEGMGRTGEKTTKISGGRRGWGKE
jgi:hypothetical protein